MRYQSLLLCLAIIFSSSCGKKEEALPVPAPSAPVSQQIADPVSDSVDAAIDARKKEERENSTVTTNSNPTTKIQ